MKIKVYVIDFEIPMRTKKWALRIAIPGAVLALGSLAFAGLPGGYADGQPLTAEALTNNFNYLQSEIAGDGGLQGQISALQGTALSYACPPGYTSATATSPEVWSGTYCTKSVASTDGGTLTDEVVKVSDYWIDRYELSECEGASGGTDAGAYPPGNGSDTTAMACSVRGVQPVSLNWFEDQALCLNAGKHLCTNAEWQGAVRGTPDPGYFGGSSEVCNTTSDPGAGPYANASGTPANTLAHLLCYSHYGAYDMVGNVWEEVADWSAQSTGNSATRANPWPTGFGGDETYNINGQAYSGQGGANFVSGLPATFVRGGSWTEGAGAGAFAVNVGNAPSASAYGARCCASGR